MNFQDSSLRSNQFYPTFQPSPLGDPASFSGTKSFSKGILNCLEVVNSRLTDQSAPHPFQNKQNNAEKCSSCYQWEEWSIQAQKQMLIIEKQMIQKQMLLQSKMREMVEQLQQERRKSSERQETWEKQRHQIEGIIKSLRASKRQVLCQQKCTQTTLEYRSELQDMFQINNSQKNCSDFGRSERKTCHLFKLNHLFGEKVTQFNPVSKNEKREEKNYEESDSSSKANLDSQKKAEYFSNANIKSHYSIEFGNNLKSYSAAQQQKVGKGNLQEQDSRIYQQPSGQTLQIPSINRLPNEEPKKSSGSKKIEYSQTLETIKANSLSKISNLERDAYRNSIFVSEDNNKMARKQEGSQVEKQESCFDFRRKEISCYLPSLKFINKNNGKQCEESCLSNPNVKRNIGGKQKLCWFAQQNKTEAVVQKESQKQLYLCPKKTSNYNNPQFMGKNSQFQVQGDDKKLSNYQNNPLYVNYLGQFNSRAENMRQNRYQGLSLEGGIQERTNNWGVSDKKSVDNKTATDCSYFKSRKSQSQIPQAKAENCMDETRMKLEKQKQDRQGKQKQLIQRLLNLEFENQNLKSYNRVLLQKLSNSRPKKY